MSRFLFKYNVENRGREGNGKTWVIKDLDTKEETFTNHIELKVPVSTQEKQLGLGFGMTANGILEHKNHPSVGDFIVIKKEDV